MVWKRVWQNIKSANSQVNWKLDRYQSSRSKLNYVLSDCWLSPNLGRLIQSYLFQVNIIWPNGSKNIYKRAPKMFMFRHCRMPTLTDIQIQYSSWATIDWLESNKSCWKCKKKGHYNKNNISQIWMFTYTSRCLANFFLLILLLVDLHIGLLSSLFWYW